MIRDLLCERYRLKIFEQIVTVAYVKKQLPRCTVEKGVLKNFKKFTGKHLRWSLFNKVAGLRAFNFIK